MLASAAVGSALHEVTFQNLINVLDFGMDANTAVEQPNTRGPYYLNARPKPEYEKEAIGSGDFSPALLDKVQALGQAIKIVSRHDQAGYWIGIQIDPQTHRLNGGATRLLPSLVEGY